MTSKNILENIYSDLTIGIKKISNNKENKPVNSSEIKKLIENNNEVSSIIDSFNSEQILKLSQMLIETKNDDFQLLGIYLLAYYFQGYNSEENLIIFTNLTKSINKWSNIDSFAPLILNFTEFDSIKVVQILDKFNKSSIPNLQRASLTAYAKNITYYCDYYDIIVRFCENVKFSDDPLVQKGLGIALKSLLKCNKAKTKRIIRRYRKEGAHSSVSINAMKDLSLREKKEIIKSS